MVNHCVSSFITGSIYSYWYRYFFRFLMILFKLWSVWRESSHIIKQRELFLIFPTTILDLLFHFIVLWSLHKEWCKRSGEIKTNPEADDESPSSQTERDIAILTIYKKSDSWDFSLQSLNRDVLMCFLLVLLALCKRVIAIAMTI